LLSVLILGACHDDDAAPPPEPVAAVPIVRHAAPPPPALPEPPQIIDLSNDVQVVMVDREDDDDDEEPRALLHGDTEVVAREAAPPQVDVEVDRDSEDVPDSEDRCPDLPENVNGYDDIDGCPEPDPALVIK
jgi:hypothetical protein